MDKIQIEEQIDRFIQDKMTADERQQFCLLMEEDEDLKELVTLRYTLMEGMLRVAEQKAMLAMEESIISKRRYTMPRWVAACIAILLLGGGIWYGKSPEYTPHEIYMSYYAIPAIERARGGNGLSVEMAIVNNQIVNLFESGGYQGIVEIYEKTLPGVEWKVLPDYTLLYISISLLEQKETDKAISILSQIQDSEYQEEVDWILLCCYLNRNDRHQAINQAQKIRANKGKYIDASKQIEVDLKKTKWF